MMMEIEVKWKDKAMMKEEEDEKEEGGGKDLMEASLR